MVVLLFYFDVNGVLGDGLPDNGTFLVQFLGSLVKIFWGIIGAGQDLPSSGGDCVVARFPVQFPTADGGLLCKVELLIVDFGSYCLLDACLGHMLKN